MQLAGAQAHIVQLAAAPAGLQRLASATMRRKMTQENAIFYLKCLYAFLFERNTI